MNKRLRSQHGVAISPAVPSIVEAVTLRLSSLATQGESFTTPDFSETEEAIAFAEGARVWTNKVKVIANPISHHCHDTSAEIARLYPARYRHVFGYALNGEGNDGHWRTHSWLHDLGRDLIIETTPYKRRAYIGVEL